VIWKREPQKHARVDREREASSLASHLVRTLISFLRAPPSEPNYLPKVPSPSTITLGIRASAYEF